MKLMSVTVSLLCLTIGISLGQEISKTIDGEFFPGFEPFIIQTSGASIYGQKKGNGPALLMLHGYPQTHLEWHKIASKLAEEFTVVLTDLRGYGNSSKPEDGVNHFGYSKRAMSKDQVEVMQSLGFDKFMVVAHDRGGRVGHRMALDYPDNVLKLVVLDIVPTHKLYTTTNQEFATVYWHWYFLIQPAPFPETLLLSNADFVLRNWVFRGMVPQAIPEAIYQEYLNNFKNREAMHAMCEDYRAGASIDLEHDEADLDKKVKCPLLVLWGADGAMEGRYDVLETWRERAADVEGKALPGGHWLPEQSPDQLYKEVIEFLTKKATNKK